MSTQGRGLLLPLLAARAKPTPGVASVAARERRERRRKADFRRALFRKSDEFAAMTLPSGLPESIAEEENIARFLTQSGNYNASMVRPSAFCQIPTMEKHRYFGTH